MTETTYECVETGDRVAVYHTLNDTIIDVISADKNYEMYYAKDNCKLFLMTVACVIGAFCHFYKDRQYISEDTLNLACVCGYFAIQGILYILYDVLWKRRLIACKNKKLGQIFKIDTDFKDAYFILTIHSGQSKAEKKLYIGKYFDYDGYFDQTAFEDAFRSFLRQCEKLQVKKTN